jgi:hypothetical protein
MLFNIIDDVAIRHLIMTSKVQHPRRIVREQSLTSNSQARAGCTQAAGRVLVAAGRAGAGPGLLAAPTPPFALAAGAG